MAKADVPITTRYAALVMENGERIFRALLATVNGIAHGLQNAG